MMMKKLLCNVAAIKLVSLYPMVICQIVLRSSEILMRDDHIDPRFGLPLVFRPRTCGWFDSLSVAVNCLLMLAVRHIIQDKRGSQRLYRMSEHESCCQLSFQGLCSH